MTNRTHGPGFSLAWGRELMKYATIAVSLAIVVSACGGLGAPLGPSSLGATYTLSGATFETTSTGRTPVEGVVIEEASTHQQATTDENGFYSISGLRATATTLISATKSGYVTNTRTVTISSDTHLDIRVERHHTLVERHHTLVGTVAEEIDGRARRLAGVSLVLGEGYGDLAATTDEEGRFSIVGIHASGTWELVVSKTGYEPLTLQIAIIGDTTLAIVLNPDRVKSVAGPRFRSRDLK